MEGTAVATRRWSELKEAALAGIAEVAGSVGVWACANRNLEISTWDSRS